MSEKLQETIERGHWENLRKNWKRNCKPVRWNGLEFESASALGRHLRLGNVTMVSQYIAQKWPIKGHVPEYIKK